MTWLLSHWWLLGGGAALVAVVVFAPAFGMLALRWLVGTELGRTLLLVAGIAAAFFWYRDARYSAGYAAAVHAQKLAAETARADDLAHAREVEQTKSASLAATAAAYEKGIEDGKLEADQLRRDVGAGVVVLRDKFKCPKANLPGSAAGAGIGDGAAPAVLSTADADFLVRLAAEADDTRRQLAACQAVVEEDRK